MKTFDIIVDGRELEKGTRRTGLSRYLTSFLKTLGEKGKSVLVLSNKRTDKDFISQLLRKNVDFVDVRCDGAVLDQVSIPRKVLGKSKTYFSIYPKFPVVLPLAGIRTVILIGDLIDFSPFQKMFLKLFGKLPYRVIVISDYWKEKIEKLIKRETVKIYLDISYTIERKEILDRDKLEKNLSDLGIRSGRYLLYVGNFNPHKNVGVLLSAFEKVKDKTDLQLILAGGGGRNAETIEKKIKNYERIKIVSSPPDELLFSLIKQAFACVFPSLSEGLGLPPLESACFGKALILSDIGSFREIAGDSAIFFDPLSSYDLATKILILYHNQELKRNLELRARKIAQKFLSFSTGEEIYKAVFG